MTRLQIDDTGWHRLYQCSTFTKWGYKDSPYRVIAHLEKSRGHWSAIFTTTFHNSRTHTIRGNCGGGNSGRTLAVSAAKQWMRENKNGCPPPGEIQ